MRGLFATSMRFGVLILGCAAAAGTAAPGHAWAQSSYSPYAESAPAALARYMRTLAESPRDFGALIGAGRAALAIGDAQSAAGFFGRADEISPSSPLPQAGMGAVAVHNGDPQAALTFFARAQQLGAPIATFGADRGLAYDLMGQQVLAQADYRASLGGQDGDEARRRLALSLAISGNKAEAIQTLAPLQARGDAAGARCRALVLALSGDSKGAMIAIDAAMPGSWASVAPFLQRLPSLQAGQKAAAVNLGIFPDGGSSYAYSAPSAPSDRLAGIDELLKPRSDTSVAVPAHPPSWEAPARVQVAYSAPPVSRKPSETNTASSQKPRKIWLQLASGPNSDALPEQFQRIKSKNREIFDGIKGYVAKSQDRSRLLIGPFRSSADAETFAESLESVNAFRWTNSETDTILPIGTN